MPIEFVGECEADAELLGKVRQMLEEKKKQSQRGRPNVLAQAMELQARFDKYSEAPEDFQPGDICVEKPLLSQAREHVGTIVYMVWGKFDPDNPLHTTMAKYFIGEGFLCNGGFDLIVGLMNRENDAIAYMPYCSRNLQKLSADVLQKLNDDGE